MFRSWVRYLALSLVLLPISSSVSAQTIWDDPEYTPQPTPTRVPTRTPTPTPTALPTIAAQLPATGALVSKNFLTYNLSASAEGGLEADLSVNRRVLENDIFPLGLSAHQLLSDSCAGESIKAHLPEQAKYFYLGGQEVFIRSGTLGCDSAHVGTVSVIGSKSSALRVVEMTTSGAELQLTAQASGSATLEARIKGSTTDGSNEVLLDPISTSISLSPDREAISLESGANSDLGVSSTLVSGFENNSSTASSTCAQTTGLTTLDLAILYTDAAEEQAAIAAGQTSDYTNAALMLEVASAVEELNTALCSGGSLLRVRPSVAYQVPESEADPLSPAGYLSIDDSSNLQTALNNLKNPDNVADWLLTPTPMPGCSNPAGCARFNSDLVVLIASNSNTYNGAPGTTAARCGKTDLYNGGNSNYAFSVISRDCMRSNHQLTNAVGHNIVGVGDQSGVLNDSNPLGRAADFTVNDITTIEARKSTVAAYMNRSATTLQVPSQECLASSGRPAWCDDENIETPWNKFPCIKKSLLPGLEATWPPAHIRCINAAVAQAANGDTVQVVSPPPHIALKDQSGQKDAYRDFITMADKEIMLIGNPQNPASVIVSAYGYNFSGEQNIVLRVGGSFSSRLAPRSTHLPNPSTWAKPVISGFTFMDGRGHSAATGVWSIGGVNPTLANNIIENNTSWVGRGAGVGWESSGGRIENNIIRNNRIQPNLASRDDTYGGSCWIRPGASGFLGMDPSGWPNCDLDGNQYSPVKPYPTDQLKQSDYAYVGGAGIRVATSRYWSDHYSTNIADAVVIRNNLIVKNKVPAIMLAMKGPNASDSVEAIGAGVQLYNLPAKLINNTIVGNYHDVATQIAPPSAATPIPVAIGVYVSPYPGVGVTEPNPTVIDTTRIEPKGYGVGCVGSNTSAAVMKNNIVGLNNLTNGAGSGDALKRDLQNRNIYCPLASQFKYNMLDQNVNTNYAAGQTNFSTEQFGTKMNADYTMGNAACNKWVDLTPTVASSGYCYDQALASSDDPESITTLPASMRDADVRRNDLKGYNAARVECASGTSTKDFGAYEFFGSLCAPAPSYGPRGFREQM